MNLFCFHRRAADSIVIKSPQGSGDAAANPAIITSIFEALANTKHSSSVGSVKNMGHQFSAPLSSKTNNSFYQSLTIKTPGTDFYLPQSLAQFAPAVEQIVYAQYSGKQSSPHLRSGQEYCIMTVSQPLDFTRGKMPELGSQHFDLSPKTIAKRELEVMDRYIVSDIAELTTPFYHANFNVNDDILDNWGNTQGNIIRGLGVRPRQYAAYEIAHFDNTTAHGIIRGSEPRMRLSVSFSAQPFDGDPLSTAELKSAHKKMCSLRRDFT